MKNNEIGAPINPDELTIAELATERARLLADLTRIEERLHDLNNTLNEIDHQLKRRSLRVV